MSYLIHDVLLYFGQVLHTNTAVHLPNDVSLLHGIWLNSNKGDCKENVMSSIISVINICHHQLFLLYYSLDWLSKKLKGISDKLLSPVSFFLIIL